MWQTYFTYFNFIGWGWLYRSTAEVTDYARHGTVQHEPRLLSDNALSYMAGELAEYIEAQNMSHVPNASPNPG